MKTIYAVWGRFNPPHLGHEKMINIMLNAADRNNNTTGRYILTSQTVNTIKNPFTPEQKKKLLEKMFRGVNIINKKGPLDAVKSVFSNNNSEEKLILYVGGDRARAFNWIANYLPPTKSIEIRVVNRNGNRNYSATKLRQALREGRSNNAKTMVPRSLENEINRLIGIIKNNNPRPVKKTRI